MTSLPVNTDGLISPEHVERAIRPDTVLISVMYANNEIGSIQPIRKIAEIAHQRKILFHTDAVQAYGQIPIRVLICFLPAGINLTVRKEPVFCMHARD